MRTEEQIGHHGGDVGRNRANRSVVFLSGLSCLAVVCAAMYAISYVSSHREQAATAQSFGLVAETNVRTGTVNNSTGGQAELDGIVRGGLITFSINATPNLKTGDSEANPLIESPPDNGTRFTVSIFRDDTGEEIYKSGCLDPKQYIDNASLDVTLPKGEYPYTTYSDSYRMEDSSYLGRAAAKITAYVLN